MKRAIAVLGLGGALLVAAHVRAQPDQSACERRPVLCALAKQRGDGSGRIDRVPTPPADDSYRYGVDPKQAIDFWRPKGGKLPAPLVIFIHGGGWLHGDKSNATGPDKIAAFTSRGYAFASINYPMPPSVRIDQEPREVAAAISYLRERAALLGIDSSRVILMGHSAGAHLAALVATDPDYLRGGLASVRAVILLDGAGYDLPRERDEGGPIERKLHERAFGALGQAELERLSPVTHAALPNAGAFLIVHDADRPDAVVQGTALEHVLADAGSRVERLPIANTSHAELNWNVGKPGDRETEEIFAFLGRLGLQ